MATVSWRELLAETELALLSAVDARRIVEEACGDDWQVRLDEPATQRAVAYLDAMVARRAKGEPLQYVLGRWGFRDLDLFVDRRVLVPRPETEVVVDVALETLNGKAEPTVVDLGTGSGAIALSIAVETDGAHVWATDVSADAIAVARANLAGLGRAATRVRLVEGSWFTPLPPMLAGHIDLVVTNPPYIAAREVPDLPPEVAHWEPHAALVAGETGLEQLQHIVAESRPWLAPDGALVAEIAPHQAEAAVVLAYGAGFTDVEIRPDLAGRPRVLRAS
ncbi:MAG: release factor glutamine methyltransferase [Actinomycetota bacterium]|jgi:release factor glutamine methyltransferase